MLSHLDRKDPDRLTWCEFTDWLDSEGTKREKMHDAGLHDTGKTRVVSVGGGDMYKLSKSRMEYRIEHMLVMPVAGAGAGHNTEVIMIVYENDRIEFRDSKSMEKISELEIRDKFVIKQK
jgi:hypothetical protein